MDRLALLLVDGFTFFLGHLNDRNVYGGIANLLDSVLALLLKLGRYDVVNDVVRHGSAFLLGNLNETKGYASGSKLQYKAARLRPTMVGNSRNLGRPFLAIFLLGRESV